MKTDLTVNEGHVEDHPAYSRGSDDRGSAIAENAKNQIDRDKDWNEGKHGGVWESIAKQPGGGYSVSPLIKVYP